MMSQATKTVHSMELDMLESSGRVRQWIVIDREGKRMVMPRYSAADAIEQIAKAIAGRNASHEDKRQAWQRLCDLDGFSVKRLRPELAGRGPQPFGSKPVVLEKTFGFR